MTEHSDNLHRLAKQLVDSGRAETLEDAEAHLRTLRIDVEFASDATSAAHHDALLTVIALARRTFLGGVNVVGDLDASNRSRLPFNGRLRDAVKALGGSPTTHFAREVPRITIGSPTEVSPAFHLRLTFSGWRGGVVLAGSEALDETEVMPLSSMVAASLVVAEAYAHASGDAEAGKRELGLSLWRPTQLDWRAEDDAPLLELLPSKLWLIGIGHLGQALLWALSLLPYSQDQLHLMLQDFDVATRSTESTSVLTDQTMVGMRKTRLAAQWSEKRGFITTLTERRFDMRTTPVGEEPRVAFCGLDNASGRRLLDSAGFDFVVEAGLGSRFSDFRTISIHTFPAPRRAADIWQVGSSNGDEALTQKPAYRRLIEAGQLDQCGATTLAGVAVGAPWVGAIASALGLAEVLRLIHGGPTHTVASLDLTALEFRNFAVRETTLAINPGFAAISERESP